MATVTLTAQYNGGTAGATLTVRAQADEHVRDLFPIDPCVNGRDFDVEEQDRVPPKTEILRSLDVKPVDLYIAAEKTSRSRAMQGRRSGGPP